MSHTLVRKEIVNNQKRIRAVAIIVNDGKVLLMHRINKGKEYYVFPGGGVEERESVEQAVMREVQEETSLNVTIEKLLYHHIYEDIDNEQFFYLCRYISGKPNLGNANELQEMTNGGNNFYQPLWIEVTDLHKLLLYPLEIRDWFVEDVRINFKDTPRKAILKYSGLRQTL